MSSPSPRREQLAFKTMAAAISAPARLPVHSFAVPPIQPRPVSFAAAAAPAMRILTDRSCYRISQGESPAYAVSHADPNEPIRWTLVRNGAVVVEDQVFEAATDSGGQWIGLGGPWREGQEGLWIVTARTADREAKVQFLVLPDAEESPTTEPDRFLGVSHVAGEYRFATPGSDLQPESFLVEGARHVRNLGARNVFVHLSPQYQVEYPFDDFPLAPASLAELAATPHFQRLFALPFETFILTTYSFANWDWLLTRGQGAPVPLDVAAEEQEMASLVRHLLDTYPDKRFILKNWEGDWQLKNSLEMDTEATEAQVSEFIAWLRARRRGVVDGRQGETHRLQFAIEFNHVHAAQSCSRSMLTSVIPEVESDLIAYSSWWTLAQPGDLARRIADDVAFVRHLPGIGSRPLIVTEFGFQGKEPERALQAQTAVDAFARAGVPLALYWQIFDNLQDIGLVGRGAQRLPAWHTLRRLIGARNAAAFIHEGSQIPNSIERGKPISGRFAIRNEGLPFDPVVGYAIGLFDPAGALLETVWIKEEVPTGARVELDFTIAAPVQAGPYAFRMFQHGVELFGESWPIEVLAGGD